MFKTKNIKSCKICKSKSLKKLIELKKFPLTGIYVKKNIKKNFPYRFNQNLNICNKCGHLQLSKFVSPDLLYNNIYANRTSESFLSRNAIDFFKNFMFKVLKKKNLNGFLEIGCNDIQLIKNLDGNFKKFYGIDPIWINKKKPTKKNLNIIGEYVEKVNLKRINDKIDVVASTHNLEHLDDPVNVLKKFVNEFDDKTTFFIEVPDADLMIKNLRFDQVFHQHYHYFNINSLSNLINKLNCKIVAKSINYKFWGGSLMVAFKKDTRTKNKLKNNSNKIKQLVLKNYKKFKDKYANLSKILKTNNNFIGYGAGQMVPSFAYHLKNNLSSLSYIVDDNKNRSNYRYPDLSPKIKFFTKKLVTNKPIFITAIDGISGISGKLKKLKKSYINPLSSKY